MYGDHREKYLATYSVHIRKSLVIKIQEHCIACIKTTKNIFLLKNHQDHIVVLFFPLQIPS